MGPAIRAILQAPDREVRAPSRRLSLLLHPYSHSMIYWPLSALIYGHDLSRCSAHTVRNTVGVFHLARIVGDRYRRSVRSAARAYGLPMIDPYRPISNFRLCNKYRPNCHMRANLPRRRGRPRHAHDMHRVKPYGRQFGAAATLREATSSARQGAHLTPDTSIRYQH